jgi:hypothetical protein
MPVACGHVCRDTRGTTTTSTTTPRIYFHDNIFIAATSNSNSSTGLLGSTCEV